MAKRKRRVVIPLLLAAVLFGLLGAWRWAHNFALAQVTSQLTELNGGDVRVNHVSLGMRGLTIHDVHLYELEENEEVPWCSIDRIWMDISLWNGLLGRTKADRAIIYDPLLQFRVSADGTLLNRFRSMEAGLEPPAEQIEIRGGQVSIQQAGSSPFVVHDIDARVRHVGDELQLTGTVEDLLRAQCAFEGSLNMKTLDMRGKLSSDDVQFSSSDLSSLPVVRLDDLTDDADFSASGSASASVSWASQSLDYTAEFVPSQMRVSLRKLDVDTTITNGRLVVNNGAVTLSDIQGLLLGGGYVANGKFDIAQMSAMLDFRFDTLRSWELPAQWNIPSELKAIVDGEGHIEVVPRDQAWHTRGSLVGTARDVLLYEIEPEPIQFSVEFNTPAEASGSLPLGIEGAARMHVVVNDFDSRTFTRALASLRTTEQAGFDVDLAEKLAKFDGKFSLIGDLEIALASFDRLETVKGDGQLTCPSFKFSQVNLNDVAARVSLSQGELTISEGKALIRDESGADAGRIVASGTLGVSPLGDLQLKVLCDEVPVATALDWLGRKHEQRLAGYVTTAVKARAPLRELAMPAAWQAEGKLSSDTLRFDTFVADDISMEYQLTNGRLRLNNGQAHWLGAKANWRGGLLLESPYGFRVRGAIEDAELSSLAQHLPELSDQVAISGSVSTTVEVKGSLIPLKWDIDGQGAMHAAKLAEFQIGAPTFDWQIDTQQARVTDFTTGLLGGTATVHATYALAETGNSTLTASLANVDAAQISALVPQLRKGATGRLSADITIDQWDRPRNASGKAEFRSKEIAVIGSAFHRVSGTLQLADQRLTLDGSAATLGGRIRVTGDSPIEAFSQTMKNANQTPMDRFTGEIELRQFPIDRVVSVAGQDRILKPLRGVAGGRMKVRLDADWKPHGSGQLALRDVQWRRQPWSRELRTNLRLKGRSLRLESLSGDFAGGRIRGECNLVMGNTVKGTFQIVVTNADAQRTLSLVPDLAAHIEGPMNARIQGAIGDPWRGNVLLSMSRANVMAVSVSGLRAPIEWTFSPTRLRLRVKTSNTTARVARGQVSGRLDASWGTQLELKASARGTNLELRSLLRNLPGSNSAGTGRVSGQVWLAGRRIQSADDLAGRFEADLSKVQPLQLPVLRQLSGFVGPIQSTTPFDSGKAKGRLANGIIHLDQATIDGNVAQLLVQGKATLRGKLDLDVTAKTGELANVPTGLSRLVRSPLTLAAPTPVSLLAEANQFLSNRLIFLHVGGTMKRPIVRVQPARQLQQAAVQFFLRRAVNAAIDNQTD